MKRFHSCALSLAVSVLWLVCFGAQVACADAAELLPDPARVAEIAAMLPEQPRGLGRPIDEREHWEALAASGAFDKVLRQARASLDEPVTGVTEAFYRKIAASGSRPEWYGMDRPRGARFRQWVLAECLENEGRYLPRIEQALATFFAETTWFIPLYGQRSIENFEGRQNGIELYKAMRSWEIALAGWLLEARLKPSTRQAIQDNLRRRTLDPFKAMLRGDQPADWWIRTTNNWNAVCLSGVVGAALSSAPSAVERAFFVAAAEKLSKNFLAGFPPDGYCTEGLGYWNFGFGHYLAMTETIHQATSAGVDLLDVPNIRAIASFGVRFEIINGVYPAIADCSPGTRPDSQILYYASRRLGLGLREWETLPLERRVRGNLYQTLIHAFPNAADSVEPRASGAEADIPRTYFDHTGVLLCRPGPSSSARIGVCLKGGHNAEHHNHNDVGAFIVAVGTESPIADIGAEVYTKTTFSSTRYTSEALNSYGHSTPLVAGQLQRPGRDAAARVTRVDFSDEADTCVMDLSRAYDVPELETLQRTFVYSRREDGSLAVIDEVGYSSPRRFETALLTLDRVEQVRPGAFVFFGERQALLAEIEADGGQLETRIDPIRADLRGNARAQRLAIAFTEPVTEGRISVRITPADHPRGDGGRAVLNGGFEYGLESWRRNEDPVMCTVSQEKAHTGTRSLHIVDASTDQGSNLFSAIFPLEAGKQYRLQGRHFPVSGEGLGVVTRFYDREDRMLNLPEDEVRLAGTVFLGGDEGAWQAFSKTFSAPEGTHFGRIWIHSLNGSTVEAYLDDLEVVD